MGSISGRKSTNIGWRMRPVDPSFGPETRQGDPSPCPTASIRASKPRLPRSRENKADQPGLDEMAAATGMSPHHFQRTFRRWVGISPTKFLQYLTLDRAKASLAENASVLEASWDAGLSGPGRLHDLFVTHEAVTPGDYKRRGAGLSIRYGLHDSPFGRCLLMATDRGICGLAFAAEGEERTGLENMRRRWPAAAFVGNAGRDCRARRAHLRA